MHDITLTVGHRKFTSYRDIFTNYADGSDPLVIDGNTVADADRWSALYAAASDDFEELVGACGSPDEVRKFWLRTPGVLVQTDIGKYEDGDAFANATTLTHMKHTIFVNGAYARDTSIRALAREAFNNLRGAPSDMTDAEIEEYWSDKYLQVSPNGPVDKEQVARAAMIRANTQHPKHYDKYDREGRQWITNYLSRKDSRTHVALLSILADKYVDRLGGKDDELQEATKALWYYRYLVENCSTAESFDAEMVESILWILDAPTPRANVVCAAVALHRCERALGYSNPWKLLIIAGILTFYLREGVLPTVDECSHEIGF